MLKFNNLPAGGQKTMQTHMRMQKYTHKCNQTSIRICFLQGKVRKAKTYYSTGIYFDDFFRGCGY